MDQRVAYALRIMENNYGDTSRLRRIAGEIYLSQSRFEHLFKAEFGRTYKSYLQEIRLTKAKDLLMDRSLSIKQVASRVGYSSPYSLARVFKKRFGKTPSQYRREILHQSLVKNSGLERKIAGSDAK